MKQSQSQTGSPYEFYGKIPLRQAIPLGLQHVLAMFVGNLTPILIICGACGISATSGDAELAALQVTLLQNAMLIAGIVTEKGICRPPYTKSLKALFDDKK